MAKRSLKHGTSVIFDGNFYWKSQIDDLISRLDYPYFVFTLRASLRTCVERDRMRGKTHGAEAAEAVFRKATAFSCGTMIDAAGSVDEAVEVLRRHLPVSR